MVQPTSNEKFTNDQKDWAYFGPVLHRQQITKLGF